MIGRFVVGLTFSVLALAGMRAPSSEIPFETRALANGLRIVLSEDHRSPTVSVAVVYDAGSRNEIEGESGLAHLVEHMMFRGSERVGSGEHYVRIASHGSPPLAQTTAETTRYVQTVTSNQLEMVLFLEADRMRSLMLTPENVATERDRIRSEIGLLSDQPYGSVDEIVNREAFESYGYAHPVLGFPDDLAGLGVGEVERFHRQYYAPGNAVVAIVGDFDPTVASDLAERYFGAIPARPLPVNASFVEPLRTEESRVTVVDADAAFGRVDIAYRVSAGNTPQWYRLALAAEVLGGEGGRLGELVERGVVLDAVAGLDEQRVGSLFRISAVLAPGREVDAVIDALDSEITRLRSERVSVSELAAARSRLERLNAEGLVTTAGRAESLASNAVYYGDPSVANRAVAAFEGITVDHVASAADLYLVDRTRVIVVVEPAPRSRP